VLAAWAASPARFREDANAEEDAALGPYRDRLLVELLQNASDAATAAGVPGRMLVRLHGAGDRPARLEVANTGAPLTAAGVQALSTLRASAKRPASGGQTRGNSSISGSIGRFGVGFAAVVAVTPEPAVVSAASGGVRWSRADAAAAIAGVPELADERARRGNALPLLRLPFPVEDGPDVPTGYDTLVVLPLSDQALADAARIRRLLADLDPTLLLVLPGLAEVRIEDGENPRRVVACEWDGPDAVLEGHHWTGVTRKGRIPCELLADRPVEEQGLDTFTIAVLVPDDGWPAQVPRVLRAPQPTDEPLELPALVSVPVPLDPGRRRVQDGALARWLLDRAAEAVVELAVRTGNLALVPTSLPAGPVDAALTDRLRELLPDAPMLTTAEHPGGRHEQEQEQEQEQVRVRGREATVLDLAEGGGARVAGALTALLAPAVPGLLPAELAASARASVLRVLGVSRMGVRGLVELLAGLHRPPAWWGSLYHALAGLPARVPDRDALGALPVPLLGGRTVHGPRGVLLPTTALAQALANPGGSELLAAVTLRVAHPDAVEGSAAELLRQLGAREATPRELLDAVVPLLPSLEDPDSNEDEAPPVDGVLALVAAADLEPGEVPALGRLRLPDRAGELLPAEELVLPGSPFEAVLADDAPFGILDAAVAAAWPAGVLEAVGVLRTFALLRDGATGPAGGRGPGGQVGLVLDPDDPLLLELDDSDRWLQETSTPIVVDSFVAVRDLELVRWPDALALLAAPDLRPAVLASDYTRWWLSAHQVLGGLLPGETALPGSPLAPLYDEVPNWVMAAVDAELLVAIGVRDSIDDVLADPDATLDLLDRLGEPERSVSWALARVLYVRAARALEGVEADPPLRVRTPGGIVAAEKALVVDRPDLLPLLGGRPAVRVPLADAAAVARVLGVPLASSHLGAGARPPDPPGSPAAQARVTAWQAGRWADRHAIAVRLAAAGNAAALAALDAEDDLDPLPDD